MNNTVKIGNARFSNALPFSLIAGPCQIESREHTRKMASALKEICEKLGVSLVFKSSFDKANRTSLNAPRGVGLEEGLEILAEIRDEFGLPVITDIHSPEQCARAAQAVDALQIPAFLCRQTDLLIAAAKTGKAIMVKKGQFLAPQDMRAIVEKITESGNSNLLLCERGASFGYNNLVADFRSLAIMAKTGYPVIFDATHSVQSPGGLGGSSGGDREFAPLLARAALAARVAGIFAEVHDDPERAPSDGAVMIRLEDFEAHLRQWKAIDAVAKEL